MGSDKYSVPRDVFGFLRLIPGTPGIEREWVIPIDTNGLLEHAMCAAYALERVLGQRGRATRG